MSASGRVLDSCALSRRLTQGGGVRSSLLVSDTSDPIAQLAQETEENARTFSSALCQQSAPVT